MVVCAFELSTLNRTTLVDKIIKYTGILDIIIIKRGIKLNIIKYLKVDLEGRCIQILSTINLIWHLERFEKR